jgi:2-oxoglutarate ferredoxin oxidoreductase subunit alpha
MPIEATNDFVIRFANVNGSGSASANLLFARSILRMGVPIAPRNIFPSNIQGLPTWYEVRVSERGALGARGGGADMLVAMNPQTFVQDVAALAPGGYLFYDSTRPLPPTMTRGDIAVVGLPLTEICASQYPEPRQRQLYRNMVYVGALAALLDIDLDVVEALSAERFKGKEKLIEANGRALKLGHDEAKARFDCPLGLRVRRSDAVGDRILVEGNYAAALGAVYGGATVCAWYPITPSTSVAEAFERLAGRYRVDASGKKNVAIVQAEDEIAAIGMVVGAGWNGARAFTATSGPGVSLMQEFFGLAYFAEVPVVVVDVQRGGPSTGMPTRTQQSDLLLCAFASHGDTKHILLIPDGPGEAFEFSAAAFDLAERLQTPVFVMLDLDIGMNSHLTRPFSWDRDRAYDRGKVLSPRALEEIAEFGRYKDVDGDGVPYRTLPGAHPTLGAYFTRGTSRDRYARYTEDPAPYVDNMERLARKFETARNLVPEPIARLAANPASVGIVYYGSTAAALDEALALLADEGIEADALRIRAFPLSSEIAEFVGAHEHVFLVEQNRDAQMRTLMASDLSLDPAKLVSILHYGGAPITARFIADAVASRLRPASATLVLEDAT